MKERLRASAARQMGTTATRGYAGRQGSRLFLLRDVVLLTFHIIAPSNIAERSAPAPATSLSPGEICEG